MLHNCEDQFAHRGDNVTLLCPYSGSTTWRTESTIINRWTVINPALPNKDKISVVETSTGNMNLHITSVTDIDTGRYDCAVEGRTKTINFMLYVNPNLPSVQNSIQNGSRMQGVEGQVLTITCHSRGGNPPADVTWRRGQTVLATGKDSVSYTWNPVRADDSTYYICQSNSAALVSPLTTTVELYLSLKPFTPVLSVPFIDENDEMTVTCRSNGSRPAALISWSFRGSQQSPGSRQTDTSDVLTDTYTVTSVFRTHVNRSDNGKPLTCKATNVASPIGVARTHYITSVRYPSLVLSAEVNSSNAYEGAAVEMKCLIDANPLSTVVWMNLDTQSILKTEKNVTQSVYMIRSTSCRDTGQYMCSAFNGIGTSSNNTLDLDIQCKPKIISRQGNVEDLNIHIGTKVELTLSIVSNPTPSIKWFFQKSSEEEMQPVLFASIEVQHSGVIFSTKLKKEITTKDDLGMYILNVLNSYGSDTYSFRLQEQSSKDSGSQCNCTVSGGSVAFFVVGAILCIGGICFLLVTVIIKRRKSPMKKRRAEVSSENAVQLYEGINIEEVSKKENTYDDLKETFPSMKQTTEGGSENAAQFYEGIN